jgi:hypothetical protein
MKRTSQFQPDHAGRHAQVAVPPGMVVSHQSHGIGADAPASGGNIARDSSRGKRVQPTPVAAGMHRVTGSNEGAPVVTTLDRIPDASNPNALDPTRTGKTFAPVQVSPGMNAAKHARAVGIGQMILAQAFANSAADDRAAHGHATIKPTITVEK